MECEQVDSAKICEEVGGAAKHVSPSAWHARMGHLPMKALKTLENCAERFNME
uniref:GAG-pre-integrase domain-containing protein n=1 Tax=Hyaloperonospora arabidopsidis (strain Emoy2) TaxID=559515 RepID=M4BE94_HYAAE